ncbi:ATP-binding cassette domain-containing protein, partial [Francisella tularensis]|uniref:ATP-binding cassette domain-containing protein n=1 Tax=Francisella tularensis TaxID=263 RepID=UPI002381C6CA
TQTQDYIHKPFKNLSGGQKKRVYLVQALINEPKILLLDEPLSDLDPDAKHQFLACLKEIHKKENNTLLIISHDMKEISTQLDAFIHFK